ncbi:MAG: helix-turn-helix domain-containing protein [Saprospiraceae bacterium]|nr:helix-turn-helix domain-containing protein [Saprospiraceae bacterium]
MPFRSIPTFNEFNEFHTAANGRVRSVHDDVHVFRLREVGREVVGKMPLFRQCFYQIGLMTQSAFKISYFEKEHALHDAQCVVLFKPGQLISFQCDPDWDGYVLLIKEDLLQFHHANAQLLRDFPFLVPTENSLFFVNDTQYTELTEVFEKLLAEYANLARTTSALPLIQLYARILLHKVNDLYAAQQAASSLKHLTENSRSLEITLEFLYNLDRDIEQMKSVSEFASNLHVTPKHLAEVVRNVSGLSPKDHINNKLLSVTKTLLKHTNTSINQIAAQYNFKDPAHFANFFKQHTGLSPLEYRNS